MVIIGLIGCLFLMWASWDVLKDMTSPPFILSGIWSFIYSILLFRSADLSFQSIYYLSFFASLLLFCLGFFLLVDHSGRRADYTGPSFEYKLKYRSITTNIILIVIFILVGLLVRKLLVLFSEHYIINPWQTITHGKIHYGFSLGNLLSYAQNLVLAFMAVSCAVYMQKPSRKKLIIFFILLLTAFLFAFVAGNRGSFFIIILSVFFTFLFYNEFSASKIRRVFFWMATLLVGIFVISTFWKFVYVDQSDSKSFVTDMFRIYFSLSPIAFVEWMGTDRELLMGDNTFRFVFAILNDIGFNVEVSEIKQDYISILEDKTNVYSVLQYYVADFGILYALVMQFVFGLIYGMLYKRSFLRKNKSTISRVLLALLYFPLINQFFDDKYFSIASTWLQLVFWVWFISETCLSTDKQG